MSSTTQASVITLLGSAGGVANAMLALLNHAAQDAHDPLYVLLAHTQLHLIDNHQKPLEHYHERYPNLADRITLHEFDLMDLEQFRTHLTATQTSLVLDVSWADTISMLECCDALGIRYLNSALENTAVDEDERLFGFPLTERYERIEAVRGRFTNAPAILCSGMNPGAVQWMALHLLRQYEEEAAPRACYIIEHDTSIYEDPELLDPDTIYCSWSAECFLDEAILSYPMFTRHRLPHYHYEEVYTAEYGVRVGEHAFHGCLMPHEEVLTLGELYDLETGFIYRVNEHLTQILINHLGDSDQLWDWPAEIINPARGDVSGEDMVGVLLVFDDFEAYMVNTMASRDIYPKFGTNATYFQVACGLYAGLASLLLDDLPPGARYVDALLLETDSRYGDYLLQHMKHFTVGVNAGSDGLLHARRRSTATP